MPAPEEDISATVDKLKPHINYALVQVGGQDDPFLRTRARNIAAQAVKSYKPEYGASLPTWVSQQLMQLRRDRRESQSMIRIPERVQLDALSIQKARMEFLDAHGRDPDDVELADAAAIPIKRIRHVREFSVPTVGAATLGDGGVHLPNYDSEAMDYVYQSADPIDRAILEQRMGVGGKHPVPLDKAVIARNLGLDPAQVTRRSLRLALRLQKIQHDLGDL